VYALTPFGSPLDVDQRALTILIYASIFLVPPAILVVVGRVAGRRAAAAVAASHPGPPDETELAALHASTRQGRNAGLLAGGLCTLLLGVVTVSTMLMFPHRVALKWANPDRDVPHGTTYEWQMSLGDSAEKYETGLIIGPLVGLFLGIVGAGLSPVPGERVRPVNRAETLSCAETGAASVQAPV
jgi:hypothetical protein